MTPLDLLHGHPRHRARQLRWVLPLLGSILLAVALTLAVQYGVSDQRIEGEFFRAHKTVARTGELLRQGTLVGGAAMLAVVVLLGLWALRVAHRIVRPVHTLHRALDALGGGDLGVRVELHGNDEFHEVGDALNRLVEEFSGTLKRAHALADELVVQAERVAADPGDAAARTRMGAAIRELDATLEFFRLPPRRTIRDERD